MRGFSGRLPMIPLILAVLLLSGSILVVAQEDSGYKMPPKEIAELADAPVTPSLSVGPDGKMALILERAALPPMSEIARPEVRLAGMRIDPVSNGPSRGRYYNGMKLLNLEDGSISELTGLPANARISNVSWAPNGQFFAFTVTVSDAEQIWAGVVAQSMVVQARGVKLNAAYRGKPFYWLPDNDAVVCKIIDPERGEEPEAPSVPQSPVVQHNIGKTAPARTYQDLLKNAYDEDLFEYLMSARVAIARSDGSITPIGAAGMIVSAVPSPDGQYILVQKLHRPFSYLVPSYRFPYTVEVWDIEGNLVKQIADLPLAEEVPIAFDAVVPGPRYFGWRQDAPATLYWAKAADGGDPRVEAEVRDRVYTLAAPFDGEPKALVDLAYRFRGAYWSSGDLALVNSYWWRSRQIRVWSVKPDVAESGQKLLIERSREDRYNDPGSPVLRATGNGTWVLHLTDDGKSIFLDGYGASPEGDFPFLDKRNLETGETTRLWQCKAPHYELPYVLLDDEGTKLLTRREGVSEQPNFYIHDLASGETRAVTQFPHPMPQLKEVTKELVTYEREDGVTLSATLCLPPGYSPEQGPIPMIMWAYPREYKSAAAAGQVSGSNYSFVRVSPTSALLFLARGYAVLKGPAMPIIGEGDAEPNDTYVKQLVSSAKAAVDAMVERGIADPKRIGIGGHSYGAFMVANLLTHSDLYAAGVARSGAYNRSLTPFGFQAEERTFWQAPEIYFAMSPFMHAPKVNEPILLIHGEADNNSGTFPLQSRRYYAALKGHGATVRLVMLPFESHGYRARESVMHMLWETSRWFDKHLKGEEPDY